MRSRQQHQRHRSQRRLGEGHGLANLVLDGMVIVEALVGDVERPQRVFRGEAALGLPRIALPELAPGS